MNTILVLALFLLAGFVLQTTIVWLAARVCRLDRRSWWRAAVVVVAKLVVGLALVALVPAVEVSEEGQWLLLGLQLAVDALITVWLLRRLFGGSVKRVIGAWALQLVAALALGVGLVGAFRICVLPFKAVSGSMSPNIRGYHVVEVLPDGNHLIIAANDPDDPHGIPPGQPSGAVVAETFEAREVTRPDKHTFGPDRFICNKTKFPERWDAVVYKHPKHPERAFVKRLVGLPGERFEIRDGAAWANGEKLNPPGRLGPIRYVSGELSPDGEAQPFEVTLGPDEYFVLGDNTSRSEDSRHFGPIKKELIEGVADLIYWPPARWRVRP